MPPLREAPCGIVYITASVVQFIMSPDQLANAVVEGRLLPQARTAGQITELGGSMWCGQGRILIQEYFVIGCFSAFKLISLRVIQIIQ